jgi:hypothetical protein
MYQNMHMQHQIVYATTVVGINTLELFNANELEVNAK